MKKKTLIIFLFIIILLVGLGSYFYLGRKDKNQLTSIDRDWIEKNKNEVIDISFINNLPVFNINGNGVLFDFAEQLKNDLNLELNPLPYTQEEEIPTGLGIVLDDKIEKDDILIYQDNYAIITPNGKYYANLKDIDKMTLGVIKTDKKRAAYYLKANSNITLKEYNSYEQLLTEIMQNQNKIDGIILPKLLYLEDITKDDTLSISYNISDMTKNLVLRLGDNEKLNNILKKYTTNWIKNDFQKSFNDNFTNSYFTYKNISEKDKTDFTNKKDYVYGFLETAPYDAIVSKKFIGANKEIIKNFASLISSEITWKSYKNIESMMKDFNEGKIDFYFDTTKIQKYNVEMTATKAFIPVDFVILVKNDQIINVKSLATLEKQNVSTVKNTKLEAILENYNIKPKTYDRLSKLLKSNDKILIINKESFNIYKNNLLKKYRVVYQENSNEEYHYILNNENDNQIFNQYFDFYTTFIDLNNYVLKVDENSFYKSNLMKAGPFIALIILIILLLILLLVGLKKLKENKKVPNISKEEKLRYIDALTSLKNRNYLNKSMNEWDTNEIYPQSVIVVDLNNIAYINDNYGHEEGDKVIIEAANILIKNQLENTEIIRTSGNEFLIYLVGYEEKQINNIIRKLNKDFKDLAHGFGVAIGYSMITDGTKSLDDAINEATIEMKNNKEESQNS